MTLLDSLHDGIDISEQHRATARDAVRAIWERDMKAIIQEAAKEDAARIRALEESGEEDKEPPHYATMQAIETYVGRVAQHMRQLANDSAKAGYQIGIEQRKASE